jgi:hypothetical protein
MDDQSGPRPDVGPEIRPSTPLCRRCRRQNVEPMVVNVGVVWWWCPRCGYVWGEPQRTPQEDVVEED